MKAARFPLAVSGEFPKQLCQSDLPFRVCSLTRTFRTFLPRCRAASERKEPSLFRARANHRLIPKSLKFDYSAVSSASATFLHIYRRQQRRPSNSARLFLSSLPPCRRIREMYVRGEGAPIHALAFVYWWRRTCPVYV